MPGFQPPFRKDNHSNGGGGIFVYVRDHIMAKRSVDLETTDMHVFGLKSHRVKVNLFL